MTRIVVAIAAFAAAVCFGVPSSQAGTYGDAPWCSVQNLGMGAMEWDCEYASAAACAPAIIGGNRGFCNRNPYFTGERAGAPAVRFRRHHRYYR